MNIQNIILVVIGGALLVMLGISIKTAYEAAKAAAEARKHADELRESMAADIRAAALQAHQQYIDSVAAARVARAKADAQERDNLAEYEKIKRARYEAHAFGLRISDPGHVPNGINRAQAAKHDAIDKAIIDCMIGGTGMVQMTAGEPKHIPRAAFEQEYPVNNDLEFTKTRRAAEMDMMEAVKHVQCGGTVRMPAEIYQAAESCTRPSSADSGSSSTCSNSDSGSTGSSSD